MDSRGNLYVSEAPVNEALAKAVEEKLQRLSKPESVRPLSSVPKNAIPIEDELVLQDLAELNRKQRRVFFAERRRGVNEHLALDTARRVL